MYRRGVVTVVPLLGICVLRYTDETRRKLRGKFGVNLIAIENFKRLYVVIQVRSVSLGQHATARRLPLEGLTHPVQPAYHAGGQHAYLVHRHGHYVAVRQAERRGRH